MSAISHLPAHSTPPAVIVRPPKPEKKSRAPWVIGFVLIVGLAGYLAWGRWRQSSAIPVSTARTFQAVVAPLEKTLRLSGQTSARNFVSVLAPLMRGVEDRNSIVLMYLVKPGSLVKAGALVAKLDAQPMQDHVDDVNEWVQQADADVKKRGAEQSIDRANLEQSVKLAKATFEKATQDARSSGVKTDIERELLKLSADEYGARYQEQQADVATFQQSQRSEMRILEITRRRHELHRNRHIHDVEKFTIYAPLSGLVVMQSTFRGGEMSQLVQGDQVSPGQPLLKVVNTNSMQVEATVNQAQSDSLRLGQTARVELDAFPGMVLAGKIYSIGALAVGGGRQNYFIRNVPVRIAIEGSDSRLIPDLSAHADVLIAKSDPVLQIPLNALHAEDGKSFVFVKNGGTFEKRDVSVGLRNEIRVAVLSGLTAGDEVRLD